ncbi:Polymer-forming protein [Halorubrum ezzemoulense]|uniref:Polymer-forming protein n=1 Tax=Halorubrum ezzemoulense TaxID=337243 RepID=A0A238Z289_HALEZ|nr:polymer-forming cytoskeletal protein [Halorubrum ezzemoulense]SNR77450.1 Polymer-forming protein [Halorubrum ezzemoulense]
MDDNRAVAPVIGVVILFGFLILALSLYQVEIVPQQNAETEFQHSGEVRNDLVELRAGILQAGSIDQPQYQTVELGTTYSTRVFAINPPAPAGTIRTSESYPITIAYESNETVIETIPTRFIEYQPGYNELDRSPTWYDASVLYLDARDDGGGIAVIEDHTLFDSGGVQITALQNEFRQSGTRRVTLELRPAESVTGEIPEGDLIVTIPTRLSDDEYWGETDIPNNEYSITDDTNDDGVYNLTLETTTSNLTVDTVGVQEAPENPTQNANARVGGTEEEGNLKPPQCQAGSRTLSNGETVNGDVAFRDTVELKNGATVNGDVITNSVVDVKKNARVDGSIQAGGSVSINGEVTGDVSAGGPVSVKGGGSVNGQINQNIGGQYTPCDA